MGAFFLFIYFFSFTKGMINKKAEKHGNKLIYDDRWSVSTMLLIRLVKFADFALFACLQFMHHNSGRFVTVELLRHAMLFYSMSL